jgi:putative aldouronate transport system permease protein
MRRSYNPLRTIVKSKAHLLMLLPGVAWLVAFCYIPMTGVLIAFKNMTNSKGNIIANFLASPWTGLRNFEFFFKSPDAWLVTRNTLLYNLSFIFLGLAAAVFCAIALHEIYSRIAAKFYQTAMLLPYFLSWITVSYLLYSFLNPDFGLVNTIRAHYLNMKPVSWYTTQKYWPFLFTFLNLWKGVGYSSIIYFAAITGIDAEMYEAAEIDGASKWKQITRITIPSITPQMCILTIMSLGGIFSANFGLFWQASLNLGHGMLHDVGSVIDTYVFNALMNNSDIGMASASGFYQSIVGFVTVIAANLIVRKISPENSLF